MVSEVCRHVGGGSCEKLCPREKSELLAKRLESATQPSERKCTLAAVRHCGGVREATLCSAGIEPEHRRRHRKHSDQSEDGAISVIVAQSPHTVKCTVTSANAML